MTTANYNWPYPVGSDTPAGPLQIKALADAADATLKTVDNRLVVAEPRPRGLVAHAFRTTISDPSTAAAVVAVMSVASFAVVSGRAYRIRVSTAPRSTVVDNRLVTELRYTTNGAAPTIASPVLPEAINYFSAIPGGVSDSIMFEALYKPGSSHNLRLLLCVTCDGAGSGRLYADASAPTVVQVDDIGVAVANTGTALP